MYAVLTTVLSSGTVWLSILLLMVMALLPDIVMRAYHDTFHHPDRWTKKVSTTLLTTPGLYVCVCVFFGNQTVLMFWISLIYTIQILLIQF